MQPGVASVYCTLVQQTHNGVELYVRQFPEMVGLQFGDIRQRFDTAVVVGFMCKAGALKMNPPDEEEMPEGARLVALADNGADTLHPAVIKCSQRYLHLLSCWFSDDSISISILLVAILAYDL